MRPFAKKIVIGYLESQAVRVLRRYRPTVVAVAGSVGKTSTKLAIATVLQQKYRVLVHESSYNSESGLPLSILNLPVSTSGLTGWLRLMARALMSHRWRYPYEVLVLEMGADRPGDIKRFMRFVKPDIGVITAVTPEHMEGFGSMEAVLDEEFVLARHSASVVLNGDDKLLATKKSELGSRPVMTFGVKKGDFRFEVKGRQSLGTLNGRLVLGGEVVDVQTGVIAQHSLNALTAAAAVASQLGLSVQQIKKGIQAFRPVKGRMNSLKGIRESTILDDSYNSSPAAALAALDALFEFPGRHLAILGSMNELGDYSAEGHRLVGKSCGQLEFLVTVGTEAEQYLAPAAVAAGMAPDNVRSFMSPHDAARVMAAKIQAGDVILCKGSQNGVFVEEAIKQLLADPNDQSQLVRQSADWMKRKAKQFPAPEKLPLLSPVKRVTMQSMADSIGAELAVRSCAPVAFYMLLKTGGYLPLWVQPDKFLAELKTANLQTNKFQKNNWSRPALSRYLRQKYHADIVSWAWPYNDQPDLEHMKQSGYLETEREIDFYRQNIQGKDIADIVRDGNPVIVTMKPGFGANDNHSVHAVIILQWLTDSVVLVDPDVRNTRTEFSADLVREFMSADGAGSVVLPKP